MPSKKGVLRKLCSPEKHFISLLQDVCFCGAWKCSCESLKPFRDTFVCPGHPPAHPCCPTRQSIRIPGVQGELRVLFTVLGCTEAGFVLLLPCPEGRGGVGVVSHLVWAGCLPGSLPGAGGCWAAPLERALARLSGVWISQCSLEPLPVTSRFPFAFKWFTQTQLWPSDSAFWHTRVSQALQRWVKWI